MTVEAASWEGMDGPALAARWGASAVHLFDRVGSTNDVAVGLAREGAAHGTVVVAEVQTGGRGRGGRPWHSPAGGIWLSIVLRPGVAVPTAAPVQVGRIAAAAIREVAPTLDPRIKWPNDLLAGPRKVAGILCEGSGASAGVEVLVVGVGINANQQAEHIPPDLQEVATSIAVETGRPVDREAIAGALVREVLALAADELSLVAPAQMEEIESRDALLERRIAVEAGGRTVEGTALGIAPDGSLLLRDAQGVLRRIHAGSARMLSTAAAGGHSPSPRP